MTNLDSNYEYYLGADLSNYIGEWIAIHEGKIVAHGNDVRTVARAAIGVCGNRNFLLSKVPSKETMIF